MHTSGNKRKKEEEKQESTERKHDKILARFWEPSRRGSAGAPPEIHDDKAGAGPVGPAEAEGNHTQTMS